MAKQKIDIRHLLTLILSLSGLFEISTAYARQSVLYGGGPLYTDAANNRKLVRDSGFTTLVIWTVHVQSDGDLVLNNYKIVDDGVYVGRPEWPAEVAAFKTGPTSVSRIELGLSGHQSDTFLNIRDLVFSQGTGPDGALYKNFQVIKDIIPAIDGFNYDEESHLYDTNVPYTMKQFSLMLADLGFNIEMDVFCCSEVWTDIFNFVNGQRPGTIDRIDLQCYAGGGGNDPCWWNQQFGGLRVTPGLWAYPASESGGYWSRNPGQVESQMSSWNASCNIAGGFMWYLDDMLLALDQYAVADYGNAINHALGIDPSRGIAAAVYQHSNYWGWSVEVGAGPYGELEIAAAGGQIADISSLKVNPGWQVTLYSEANFHGNTLVKTADDSTLDDDGWNDSVKSMIVSPVQEKAVTLYQHTDYWGWSAGFSEPGDYTAADMIAAGGLNNDASSVEVAPGYLVTFYTDDNFQGSQLVKTADDSTLVDDGWNDVISSMKIRIDPTQNMPVTLYQDCDYWSGWTAAFDIGAYTLDQMIAAGGLNDDASSVKIAPGYTVTFYENDNFQGPTLVKTADDLCLFDDGWNDRVSSMIIEGPSSPPVAWWQFNDNGGLVLKDAFDVFDGQLINMDQYNWAAGKQCGGLYFDGANDYIEIPGFKGVSGTTSRTCTVWIRTTTPSSRIINWGGFDTGAQWAIRVNEDGTLRTEIGGGYIDGFTNLCDGKWHHIAVVLEDDGSPDISETLLYVDGQPEQTGASLSCPVNTASSEDVKIGTNINETVFFRGLIDEVRIYNRALNAAEIRGIYQQYALTADTEPDGDVDFDDFGVLADHWQMDTCDGDLTCDCTINFDDLMVLVEQWLGRISTD